MRAFGRWVVSVAVGGLASACGEPTPVGRSYAPLLDRAPQLVAANVPWRASLVGDGVVPAITVADGALPEGLVLHADGTIDGAALRPGQWSTFRVRTATPEGDELGMHTYGIGVSASAENGTPPRVDRVGDVVELSSAWPVPASYAFAWDDSLALAWPLAGGAALSARLVAPASGSFALYVGGGGMESHFAIATEPLSADVALVARIAWSGDGDLDLRVLSQSPSNETSAMTTTASDASGAWLVRHLVSATSAPGCEAATLSTLARPGRYALVVTKASGVDAQFDVQLSIRAVGGAVVAEHRERVMLSDVAAGTAADELASGRQSWGALGVIERSGEGVWTWLAPGHQGDPFGLDPGGE